PRPSFASTTASSPSRTSSPCCGPRGTSDGRVNVHPYVRLLALILASLPLGHSVDGRPIRPVVLGNPTAEHRLLFVGCIHGTEGAGLTIVHRLVAMGAPAGTEIVVLPVLNADGCARGQ